MCFLDGSKELAVSKLMDYIDEHNDEIISRATNLATDYIRREGQFEKGKKGNNYVIELVRKQRISWLSFPQPINYPWGLVNYNSHESSHVHRGEITRSKITRIAIDWLDSDLSKDTIRPLFLTLIASEEQKSLHNILRKNLCHQVIPGSQTLVDNAMNSGVMNFLDDMEWREWSKLHMAQYIQQTYGSSGHGSGGKP